MTWWPLAASWLLMGIELPLLSAFVARLSYPEINLAAYGGVVFPISLVIEAPIIMLLAASTALSKDWDSYTKLRRFMLVTSGSLTALHILVAFTPLYYIVVIDILGVPPVIIEPARMGLMIMTPWTFSIAYRRFNQGILIRFGNSQSVGIGTVIRLSADTIVLVTGYLVGSIPGIVVATSAVASGVVSEAIYVGFAVRPVLNNQLKKAKPVDEPLRLIPFLKFYFPLAMTSLLVLLAIPIGSAAISRMPQALASLAVWPVLSGLTFMFRSMGVAYNEVVIALLDEPRSSPSLIRFTMYLSGVLTILLLLLALTPLSILWFGRISALSEDLTHLARLGLLLTIPLPALSVYQSWYQGAIIHGRKTRGITEAVVIYLITSVVVFGVGIRLNSIAGLYFGVGALTISMFTQTLWLWFRSRPVMDSVTKRDNEFSSRSRIVIESTINSKS